MLDTINLWLDTHPLMKEVAGCITLFFLAFIFYFIVRYIVRRVVHRIVERTAFQWDDVLLRQGVIDWAAKMVPPFVVSYGASFVPDIHPGLLQLLERSASAVTILAATLMVNALLRSANELYSMRPDAKARPIKGYVQIVQIFVFVMGFILIIAALLNKSPWYFLSGIGALTAVLLLVFKDTILSLVASVQLTSNDMLRVGDWIEMPSAGADGDVIDIALHTVKVQNWNKTITTIPTYSLISNGFKNWRSMPESGGRRIKRYVHLDCSSVRHLTPEEEDRFSAYELLQDYMARKKKEIEAYNASKAGREQVRPLVRRLTNLGTLRAYMSAYLEQHPEINHDMTCMVRQLQPTPQGVPLEIYCFTKRTEWDIYEGIQADIFDHILAVIPEFGLRVFQETSGADLTKAAQVLRRDAHS